MKVLAPMVRHAPILAGARGFEQMVNEGTINWVVTQNGQLIVASQIASGVHIHHSVLAGGAPVHAAGEAEIAGANGHYVGIDINNQSGHYRPSEASLEIGRQAFRRAGIEFR